MLYDYRMKEVRTELLKNMGDRIRMARLKAGMTQEGLAEILNVSRVSVGKYEAGEIEPRLERLKEMARVLDTSTDYLLGIERKNDVCQSLSPEAVYALECFVKEVLKQNDN